MRLEDIGLLGWTHTLACIVALVVGAWNTLDLSRGAGHRLRGDIYAWSMVIANVLVFAIYDFDMNFRDPPGPGIFGFFHWLAVGALVSTLIGWWSSRRQRHGVWAYVHPVAMMSSYYILLGGLANELLSRVDALRPLSTVIVNGQPRFGGQFIGMVQASLMMAMMALTALFLVRVAMRRAKRRKPKSVSAATA